MMVLKWMYFTFLPGRSVGGEAQRLISFLDMIRGRGKARALKSKPIVDLGTRSTSQSTNVSMQLEWIRIIMHILVHELDV
jgi:hypothetical protein